VVVIALLVLLWYLDRKPYIHKKISQNNLKRYFDALLYRGYDGGFITIQIPSDKKFKWFIQFAKYIECEKKVGLRFGYPLCEWSEPYYEKLKGILEREQIEFEILKTGENGVSEFIFVDVKKNLDMAARISTLTLQEVYNLNPNDFIELYFVNVSAKDEKIGF
jgi:hypothetical protein